MRDWQILVVDDEPDVHAITKLALKSRRWQGRGFQLTGAKSAAEAKEILSKPDRPDFQVALVDVVMETNQAGLELCEFMRATQPRTLRVVLRTGAAGNAPKESVLSQYDIDYYLEKAEVTADRLFSVVRACVRASLDLATLVAVRAQHQAFTEAFTASDRDELLAGAMIGVMQFLEGKHAVQLGFIADTSDEASLLLGPDAEADQERSFDVADAIAAINQQQDRSIQLVALESGQYVVPVIGVDDGEAQDDDQDERPSGRKRGFLSRIAGLFGGAQQRPSASGLLVRFLDDSITEYARSGFVEDAQLFLENWRVARRTIFMRDVLLAQVASAGATPRGGPW